MKYALLVCLLLALLPIFAHSQPYQPGSQGGVTLNVHAKDFNTPGLYPVTAPVQIYFDDNEEPAYSGQIGQDGWYHVQIGDPADCDWRSFVNRIPWWEWVNPADGNVTTHINITTHIHYMDYMQGQ